MILCLTFILNLNLFIDAVMLGLPGSSYGTAIKLLSPSTSINLWTIDRGRINSMIMFVFIAKADYSERQQQTKQPDYLEPCRPAAGQKTAGDVLSTAALQRKPTPKRRPTDTPPAGTRPGIRMDFMLSSRALHAQTQPVLMMLSVL